MKLMVGLLHCFSRSMRPWPMSFRPLLTNATCYHAIDHRRKRLARALTPWWPAAPTLTQTPLRAGPWPPSCPTCLAWRSGSQSTSAWCRPAGSGARWVGLRLGVEAGAPVLHGNVLLVYTGMLPEPLATHCTPAGPLLLL